ncbi:NDP-hexose 2,3-dehydratase family protein [Microcella sp.]|uniref:NDP-hexose 2,3-dehydratase family protein n=1 Tax=Microcella sp. TaxID=1913979 RepID=UPI003F7217C7
MPSRLDTPAWLAEHAERAELTVAEIELADSAEWRRNNGAIEHRSGRFFRVVGFASGGRDAEPRYQPLLEQSEVGTLCSIHRRGDHAELLVQAKAEPGTVGVAQLAPSIQATASNADRVHGGDAPPLQEAARAGAIETIARVVASEQGARFLGKRNANLLARQVAELPSSPSHRWVPVDELLELSAADHLVNTDLRSVLVSSPWRYLVDREPFRRRTDEIGRWLAASWGATGDTSHARSRVERAAALVDPGRIVRLDELAGWVSTTSGVAADGDSGFRVRQIEVSVRGREVPRWDQPIVDSLSTGLIELWMRVDGSHPRFGFRLAAEPGLANRVELTATVVASPGDPLSAPTQGIVLAGAAQSDEGGRFFHDVSDYRLVLADDPDAAGDDVIWLSLGDAEVLLAEGRWFTNEARSALALVLPWL